MNIKYYFNVDLTKKMISLFFISILSILSLISINNIDYVYAQFNETQQIQFNPGNIEPQPPVNAETGQDLALPGTQIAVRDPDTGQVSTKEVKFIPPKITGSSITTSISKTEQVLNTNTTLDSILTDLAAFPIGSLASAFGLTSLGQSGTEQFSTTNPKLASNPGTTVSAQDTTSTPQSDNNIGVFSTTNPVLTPNTGAGNAAGPTYNPPLKRCTTTDSANKEGGFDIAKYVITGKFDKDKLKGDDFAFQIFADLVDGDESEITGLDAPYKAKILTNNNGESPIDLYEIATVCIDTQHVINIKEKTEIDLDKSEVFKSLEF